MEDRLNELNRLTLKHFKALLVECETVDDYVDIVNAIDELKEILDKIRDKADTLADLVED